MTVERSTGPMDGMIMTVRDVAEYLRVSEAKIYKMAKEGNVPAVRIGKSWRFKRELLDEWILQETQKGLREPVTSPEAETA